MLSPVMLPAYTAVLPAISQPTLLRLYGYEIGANEESVTAIFCDGKFSKGIAGRDSWAIALL